MYVILQYWNVIHYLTPPTQIDTPDMFETTDSIWHQWYILTPLDSFDTSDTTLDSFDTSDTTLDTFDTSDTTLDTFDAPSLTPGRWTEPVCAVPRAVQVCQGTGLLQLHLHVRQREQKCHRNDDVRQEMIFLLFHLTSLTYSMFDLFTYIFATLLIPIHITLEQVQPSRYKKVRIYKVLPLSRFNAIVPCMQWCTDNHLIAQLINCVAFYIYTLHFTITRTNVMNFWQAKQAVRFFACVYYYGMCSAHHLPTSCFFPPSLHPSLPPSLRPSLPQSASRADAVSGGESRNGTAGRRCLHETYQNWKQQKI